MALKRFIEIKRWVCALSQFLVSNLVNETCKNFNLQVQMCKNVMFLYSNQIQSHSMPRLARPVGKLNFGIIRPLHESYGKVQRTLHRRKHLEGWEAARSSVLLCYVS